MPPRPIDDAALRAALDAYAATGGNLMATARVLGMDRSTLRDRLEAARRRGLDRPEVVREHMAKVGGNPAQASHGWIVTPTDDGGRVSTFWRAPPVGPDALAASFLAALEGAVSPAPPVPPPAETDADLCAMLALPDWHMLMQSWGRETGEDYDIKIAERNLREGAARLFRRAAPAQTCIILGLGDQFHANTDDARVGRGKHEGQVDGRLLKGFDVALWAFIYTIRAALAQFLVVKVRILPGNHDDWLAGALAVALSVAFHDEPRVSVDTDPGYTWRLRFGKVLLAATHGDNIRDARDTCMMMAHKYRDDFGATDFHFLFSGDKHHERTRDFAGWHWSQLRPLTPADAYSARAFLTPSEMSLRTFHARRGRQDVLFEHLPLLPDLAA
jgi:hypothetical protein